MDRAERRRLRKRGIVLASAGFGLMLLVGLGLRALDLTRATYQAWSVGVLATVAVQGLLWLIPHLGWDDRLKWDPHYLYLPMLAAAVLFSLYALVVPEARGLILMLWLVPLLFTVGHTGFVGVAILSAVMALGYLAGIAMDLSHRLGPFPTLEVAAAGVFLITCLYSGVVFERLRRQRRETQALRRSLAELALTDPLTGLPNRRQFEEAVRNELGRIHRHGGRCAVAMIDVDSFKIYNDLLGHPAGDAFLKDLAQVLRSHLRAGDVGARYGGDEFAVLMTDTARGDGTQALERLRSLVEVHLFRRSEIQPGGRFTISAGVACCPEDGKDYETLLQKADAALYVAKSQGRNQVVVTG